MVYSNNFVVVVKCNGKILREKDGFVTLPFGSEYSLLIKNLESRKVSAKISIDGQEVMDGSLLLNGNTESELEGFVKGNIAKNSFKFIQKTKQIQDHRGDKIDDGMIRVEFAFEKRVSEVVNKTIITEHHHYRDWWYDRWYPYYRPYYPSFDWTYTCQDSSDGKVSANTVYYSDSGTGNVSENSDDINVCSTNTDTGKLELNGTNMKSLHSAPNFDEGITVKGSEINQQFTYGSIGSLEQPQVIILRLRGEKSNGTMVQQPVTVKTKLTCPTCGKTSKSSSKYCGECGTFLE